MFEIVRPDCLDDDQWAAIDDHRGRMERALRDGDLSLVIGSAKELCETSAKLVWVFSGQQFASATDMGELVSKAQLAVDRLPGYGSAASEGARDVAQTARKLVVRLVEVRNAAGTGHGQVASPAIDEPDAAFLADAALLWCRWILQRLDIVAASSPVKLIADLRSEVFYKGVLAGRIADARIDDLGEDDQRAIGLAVGQRAAGGTVVVWQDGVLAAAASADLSVWPPAYREGAAEGLLIDANGYVRPAQGTTEAALALLAPLPDGGAARLQVIESLVRQSALAYPATDEQRDQAVGVLRAAADSSSVPHSVLLSLADAIAALGR